MRRVWLAIAVVIALAIGAVVATDGALRREVERRVAQDLTTSVPFTTAPEVTIDGYPFLWHAATGRFPAIHVRGDAMPLPVEGVQATVTDVDLTLTDVATSASDTRATTVAGTARLPYDDLSALAGIPIAYADARLVATYQADVLGVTVSAVVSGVPVLDAAGTAVTLGEADVSVAGFRLGPDVSQRLIDTLVKPTPIALPFGLRLAHLDAKPSGLVVEFTGTDVVFPR